MCHHADTDRSSASLVLGAGRVLSPALPLPRRIADGPSLYYCGPGPRRIARCSAIQASPTVQKSPVVGSSRTAASSSHAVNHHSVVSASRPALSSRLRIAARPAS